MTGNVHFHYFLPQLSAPLTTLDKIKLIFQPWDKDP